MRKLCVRRVGHAACSAVGAPFAAPLYTPISFLSSWMGGAPFLERGLAELLDWLAAPTLTTSHEANHEQWLVVREM